MRQLLKPAPGPAPGPVSRRQFEAASRPSTPVTHGMIPEHLFTRFSLIWPHTHIRQCSYHISVSIRAPYNPILGRLRDLLLYCARTARLLRAVRARCKLICILKPARVHLPVTHSNCRTEAGLRPDSNHIQRWTEMEPASGRLYPVTHD